MWLAIETALSACSVALVEGGRVLAERHEEIARGHAERLIPLVAELLAEAGDPVPEAIVVDVGPGSFTGLRVGLAAARAFALAWAAPASGASSTAIAAADAFRVNPGISRVCMMLEAGRGQLYVQPFERDGDGLVATAGVEALTPAAAARFARDRRLPAAGAGAALAAAEGPLDLLGGGAVRAAGMALLGPDWLDLPLSPLYVRPADAVAVA